MNQFFSFSRFNSLVLMHWVKNKKRYALSVLAYIGLVGIWLLFSLMTADQYDTPGAKQQGTYLFSLFVVGTFYASQYFNDLGSRAKAINFLLVPASTLEKFLCSVLYTVFLFIVVFTAAFYLADFFMLALSNQDTGANGQSAKETVANVFDFGFFVFRADIRVNGVLFFLSIQSFFLLGSVYFKKYSFLKTILSCFVVYLILFSISYSVFNPIFPGDGTEVSIPRWIEKTFQVLVMYIITPVLWLLTYYRLKQKQV